MTHPCDGHACDHCYLCDVVGICCATVSSAAAASAGCSHDHALHDAIVEAAPEYVGLGQLIRLGSDARLLPAPSRLALAARDLPLGDVLSINQKAGKETEDVLAPRRHQQ